jgi:hypothetical protein
MVYGHVSSDSWWKQTWYGAWLWRRLTQRRSYAEGGFGMIARKRTDLKGKRLLKPQWITLESLANVRGTNVISQGLRPVPINRWTVLPYCSHWLDICFCVTLVPLLSVKPKVLNVIQYCSYIDLWLGTKCNSISSCLRWCSEVGEGIERRVASAPSPQQNIYMMMLLFILFLML